MDKYPLYNGEVELNYEDARHLYTVGDKNVFGVTSITGVISKPALIPWAVNTCVKKFQDLFKPGVAYDEIQIEQALKEAKGAHRQVSERATDIGTLVHKWLEDWINGKKPEKPVNAEMQSAIDGFFQWVEENDIEFIKAERKVYSKEYEYAGTLDAIAKINGKLAVIDFKTSKAIYDEYLLQSSAYRQAVMEEDGTELDSYIVRFSKFNDNDSFEVLKDPDPDKSFETFKACLQIYKWQQENKSNWINKNQQKLV
uniref:Putative PD-(D/E)XK nuclease superfamily protein n=1 Tax=viral metagenome TaxID=1070528 RepID=A0A6M3Y4H6_9ZZZZ